MRPPPFLCYSRHISEREGPEMTYQLAIDEGDGLEIIDEGSKAKMEREMSYLLSDLEEGGEREGEPRPEYFIQPAS